MLSKENPSQSASVVSVQILNGSRKIIMKIYGLQKMTLLDFPGRVACTVFLAGCGLRCPFCHNYELAVGTAPPVMEEKELAVFLEKRRGLLDGVAVTGGEPCLNRDLPDLLRRIRSLGYAVKLDTNGQHPRMLAGILQNGLADYVAMDIKNSPAKYAETAGLASLDLAPIKESVRLLMESPADYEFRTTVVDELHGADDFEKIGEWIAGAKRYFLQAFTDRDTVPYENFHAPARPKMEEYLAIVRRQVPESRLRGVD